MASYVVVQRVDDMLYFSGASQAGLLLLSQLKKAVGDLDNVVQIVKLFGIVASSNDFYKHPAVINGASELFVEVFGDKGKHARSAIGTSVLPWNLPLEVEKIVRVK